MEKEQILNQIIEKLDKVGHVPDIFMKGGLAYLGYKSTEVEGNPMAGIGGAVTALVSLKLATGNNLAGGAAGVTGLTLIGLGNAFKDVTKKAQETRPFENIIGENAPFWTFMQDWWFPGSSYAPGITPPYSGGGR